MTYNQEEIIAFIYKENPNFYKGAIKEFLDATFDAIKKMVASGNKVFIHDFGTFEIKTNAEHMGRNFRTNEPCIVPKITKPVFNPSKVFKEMIQ